MCGQSIDLVAGTGGFLVAFEKSSSNSKHKISSYPKDDTQ